MMGLDLHQPVQLASYDEVERHRVFLEEMDKLSKEWVKMVAPTPDLRTRVPEISREMDAIREASFCERVEFYRAYRVGEQAAWFDQKADQNSQHPPALGGC